MECFRPDPHDLRVKAVKKPYEKAKAMYVRVEGDDIQLRGHKGGILESIPMHMVRWLPCSLPGGIDHCISLQYKQPQTKEIFLKAKTRSAVADILNSLDAAAAGKTFPAAVEIQALCVEEETTASPIDITEQQESVDRSHSSARCPRCWQLAQLLDEHEAQLQEMDVLKAELESCRADLLEAIEQRNEAVARAASAADLARAEAQARLAELEACLAEATDRCEKLVKELRLAAAAADDNASKCRELQNAVDKAEEEKKFLVEALTTAQAQLHDAQEAFKETASQLQGASKSCAATKSQASITRSELEKAREEALKHSELVRSLQNELKTLQINLERAQQDAANSQRAWAEEKGRLEGALAAMNEYNNNSHSSLYISSNEHTSTSTKDRTSIEAMVLRTQVDELKEQLINARAAAAEREHKERTHAAEAAAKRAQKELDSTQKTLEEHYAALQEEAKSLRAQVGTAQLDAANAATALDSQRAAAKKLEDELIGLQERLTAALTAQSAAVKERHGLEAAIDRSKVEIDRLVRRNKALEARCQEYANKGGKIAVSAV
jgi:chromosome segregation ATPase